MMTLILTSMIMYRTALSDCIVGVGEDELCTSSAALVTSTTLECTEDESCCLCESITCNNCEKVELAYGGLADISEEELASITANGDPQTGLVIESSGYTSAASIELTATNVKSIEFSGQESFAFSKLNAECRSSSPCPVECGGTDSCFQSELTIFHSSNFEAILTSAAEMTILVFDMPAEGFNLECKGEFACLEADIEIIISDCGGNNTYNLGEFEFKGAESGLDAHIAIYNEDEECTVYIEKWICDGAASCHDMNLFITGNVTVLECECGYNNGVCNSISSDGDADPSGVIYCLANPESESSDPVRNDMSSKKIESDMLKPSGSDGFTDVGLLLTIFGVVAGVLLVVFVGYCLYTRKMRSNKHYSATMNDSDVEDTELNNDSSSQMFGETVN